MANPLSESQYKIVFDQSHNNAIEIETNSCSSFIQWLFQQGFRVGKIVNDINYAKLMEIFSIQEEGQKHDGNLLILGNPQQKKYSLDEIYAILEYVKTGGNILIFCDEGGDISANTNLNELTSHFGFKIQPNIIFDENCHITKMVWPLIHVDNNHPISNDVSKIVYASGCSFETLKRDEFAEFLDVKLKPIIKSSETSKMKIFDMNLQQWREEWARGETLGLAGQFFDGRFFIFGTPSILSSLNSNYGLNAKDNHKLMENIIAWLLGEREAALGASFFGDKVQVQLRVDKEMFRWANSPEILEFFGDFSSLVNHALTRLKKSFIENDVNVERKKPKYSG